MIKSVGRLFEISVVSFPADGAARITEVRSEDLDEIESIRDLEGFLRDAGGFSKSAATASSQKPESSSRIRGSLKPTRRRRPRSFLNGSGSLKNPLENKRWNSKEVLDALDKIEGKMSETAASNKERLDELGEQQRKFANQLLDLQQKG